MISIVYIPNVQPRVCIYQNLSNKVITWKVHVYDNIYIHTHCITVYYKYNTLFITYVGEDPEFKDIIHQLDMWHKSNKLNVKLVEVK